ncbi:MAG: hypothetical protein A3D13_02735 [Planctomycetes bacterium RIFCSPHIGHO2_02_FULL_40_12]|nr:MAG: hypothetical protein A3D13_02735 [Planctomycetes bacterium RIFCSPHIGHO2_02_FULL_40_12]
MKIRFLKPAQSEVDDAVVWYDSQRGLWGQVFNLAILLHQILSLMVLPCNIIYRLRKLASRVKTCPPIPTPLRTAPFSCKGKYIHGN